MNPITTFKGPDQAATFIQRTFRHHRYLKRVAEKGLSHKIPIVVRELGRNEFSLLRDIVNRWEFRELEIEGFYDAVSKSIRPHKNTRIIIASNLTGEVQGLTIFNVPKNRPILIDYLVTAPRNLTNEGSIKGVGTALIERLIHLASNAGIGEEHLLDLDSVLGANSFYERSLFIQACGANFLFPAAHRADYLNKFGGRAIPLD